MKNSKENLGYEITEEFKEIQGRFNQTPWLLFLLYIGCGALWYIHITTISEAAEKGIVELILLGIGMAAEAIGALAALWYIIRKEKAGFSFALGLSLAFISARVCAISFPIIYHNVSAYEGAEKNIALFCIVAALAFYIFDIVRFYGRYQKGCYAKGEARYSFSFGKKEKAAIAVIVISMFPIMFRGVRLTLHNTSIPQEVLNLYGVYLMSLVFCMLNRFSLKALTNVMLYRRK